MSISLLKCRPLRGFVMADWFSLMPLKVFISELRFCRLKIGVCSQTHTVLRQARTEKVKPILVLNKIDRLITELKFTPMEAYAHLNKVLEQVNAILGTFEAQDLMEDATKKYEASKEAQEGQSKEAQEASTSVDDIVVDDFEEEQIYFSPTKGNVIFASAIDGWAFRVNQFARIYSKKLGINENMLNKVLQSKQRYCKLNKVLWGDFYLDRKAKRVVKQSGLKGKALKPMFVQFVLDNLW
jgi:ribosome assembly protein 1